MISPLTREELKVEVWSCDGAKSPSPDGFSLEFFKSYWETIEVDLFNVVQEFFFNAKLPRAMAVFFVALILKKTNPQSLKEFKSISLIGSIQKIITKIMALRLK